MNNSLDASLELEAMPLKPPARLEEEDGLIQKDTVATARSQHADAAAKTVIRCLLLILTWYVLSTCLGMFNKKLVGKKHGVFGNGAFPAPLLLTGIQFFFQHLLARLTFATGIMQRTASARSWKDWSKLVLPNGAITGLDIGFSNASLVHITMSFYTMCKSTTPIFLLAFAFIWRLETPSWSLAGVVAVISTGLLLLVQGEAEFNTTGFVLVMSASAMSGLRFTLTQLLLHGKTGKRESHNGQREGAQSHDGHVQSPKHGSGHGHSPFGGPLEVLEMLTPVMSVTTLLMSLITEQLWNTLPGSPYFSSFLHILITLGIVMAGAVMAFLMVWAEYQVIKETSALTFMIAGTVKEVVTVLAAVLVFGDKFGLINGIGLMIVIAGVLLFNLYKLQKLRQEVREQITSREGSFGYNTPEGVPIHMVACGRVSSSTGSPVASPRFAAVAPGASAAVLLHKRRSSIEELEAQEVLKALEFEPLLPMNGVMIRR